MLQTRKIARGYQITLPRFFRERYNLDIGDSVEFIEENGKLIVKPVKKVPSENAAKKLLDFLNRINEPVKDMSEDEILERAHQQRKKARKVHADSY